jgi:hypothetical protein
VEIGGGKAGVEPMERVVTPTSVGPPASGGPTRQPLDVHRDRRMTR